jgi:uncharacterized membrane protein|tara:strand:+ start:1091 stop:1309 length:219 start_codon:yes stop_codon:yes gene_type:complete
MKKLGKVLWYLIFGVGYLALYFKYYVPTEWGKKRNTATTARQFKAKHFWGPVNAVLIYLSIIAIFIYYLMEM